MTKPELDLDTIERWAHGAQLWKLDPATVLALVARARRADEMEQCYVCSATLQQVLPRCETCPDIAEDQRHEAIDRD